MKKKNSLWGIIVIVTACILLTNSWATANNVFVNIKTKSDLPDSVIIDYIHNYCIEIDSLNSLLSQVCKKNKIQITDWKAKYSDREFNDRYYMGYRLAMLYGYRLEDVERSEGDRLIFFIAAVSISDYEILDLSNFKDPALNMNSCTGETVLTTAVLMNNLKMVKYLLKQGVDKNKRAYLDYDDIEGGKNAYEVAKSLGYKDIMKVLK